MLLLDAEAVKLFNFQINLEKSVNYVLERLKRCRECDLLELSNDMEKMRQNECNTLQTKMNDVLEPLRYKIQLIKNKELGSITDFKHFKKEMIILQDNIQTLKYNNKMQIDHLKKEASCLSDDIKFYSEKLLEWSEPINININYVTHLQNPKGIRTGLKCKEVKIFMDFVSSTGGHENGWRREDHYLFLKFRKKFKSINIVAEKLHEELPDISIQDVKNHEEWYQKYINLEKKRRNALRLWQKEKASKIVVANYSNISSKITSVTQPSVNIQEKLMKWKEQKEEQMKTAKQIEMCKKQRKNELEDSKKKKNEELKMLVLEWKQRRHDTEDQEMVEKKISEEQEKKRRALEANKLIKQFQSQDDIYISKMKRKRKTETPPVRRSKSSHSAKRDPARLLKPTKQWINRIHDANSSDLFGRIMPLRCLPKLGVPEWRKKLD